MRQPPEWRRQEPGCSALIRVLGRSLAPISNVHWGWRRTSRRKNCQFRLKSPSAAACCSNRARSKLKTKTRRRNQARKSWIRKRRPFNERAIDFKKKFHHEEHEEREEWKFEDRK